MGDVLEATLDTGLLSDAESRPDCVRCVFLFLSDETSAFICPFQ